MNNIIFVNVTEMESYEGLESNLKGGGSYIEKNSFGHEILNFKDESGLIYGYSPPYGKVNLKRIGGDLQQDEYGTFKDNIKVIFTCSIEGNRRVICGFYDNAKIYSRPITEKLPQRFINTDLYIDCNIICNAEDAFLIPKEKRAKFLSKAKAGVFGWGRHSMLYIDTPERFEFANEYLLYVQEYIDKSINDGVVNDEISYSVNEGEIVMLTSISRKRSTYIKKRCIEMKGTSCKICGFDFTEKYGELGKGYIQIHHLNPLANSTADVINTNVSDLIPVCANCHAMLHRKKNEILSPEELIEIIKKQNEEK